MIKLKKLELFNFRSFKGHHVVEFPENGLVLIRGVAAQNESTSGVGKSALLSSIAYAFDYCPVPATKIQNWFDDKSFWVSLHFTIDADCFVLTRGPSKLKLSVNGTDVLGGKSVVEQKLKDVLQISPNLLEVITYRQQRTRSIFFSKTDSKKKDFLSEILGLSEIEEVLKSFNQQINKLTNNIEGLYVINSTYQDEFANLKEPQFLDAGDLIYDLVECQSVIDYFKLEADRLDNFGYLAKKKIEIKKEKRTQIIHKIKENYDLLIKDAKTRIEEYKTNYDPKQKSYFQKLHDSFPELKNEKKKIELELTTLNNSVCYTCNRTWRDDALQAKIDDKNERLFEINSILVEEKEIFDKLNELVILEREDTKKINELYYLPKELESEKSKKVAEEIEKRSKSIDLLQNLINKYTTQFSNANLRVTQNTLLIGKSATEKKNYDFAVQFYNEHKAQYEKKIAEIQDSIKTLEQERSEKEDFVELIGKTGFLGSIFEEVLNDISAKISDILKSVPNVSNCTIAFQSSTETEKGEIRSKITPIVYKDGTETIPDLLSGGQLSSLELATDLAVASVIQSRTGKLPCWLVEDEAFDGLSNIDKESCLELLKNQAADKLILVVDHDTEVKEFFDKVIDVELVDGKNSRII